MTRRSLDSLTTAPALFGVGKKLLVELAVGLLYHRCDSETAIMLPIQPFTMKPEQCFELFFSRKTKE